MKTKKEIYDSVAISADALKLVEYSEKAFRHSLGKLVADCVGENQPMAFNDETGFPTFKFDNGDESVILAVIAVKGADNRYYFDFNDMVDEESDYGLDADGWVSEFDVTYDSHDLYNAITEWIDCKY